MSMLPTVDPETGIQPEGGGGPEAVKETAKETAVEAQEALYMAEDKAITLAERVGQVFATVWTPVAAWKQKMADKLNTPPGE